MSYVFSFTFFSLLLIFSSHWWPLTFLILSQPLQNFHVVLPTKKCVSFVFISLSRSLSPFFSLSFAGLPSTFSFTPSFSCSIFQIYGHDDQSKLNTLENTVKKEFPLSDFVFIDSLAASALQDAGGYAISRKITSSSIWVAIPVD